MNFKLSIIAAIILTGSGQTALACMGGGAGGTLCTIEEPSLFENATAAFEKFASYCFGSDLIFYSVIAGTLLLMIGYLWYVKRGGKNFWAAIIAFLPIVALIILSLYFFIGSLIVKK